MSNYINNIVKKVNNKGENYQIQSANFKFHSKTKNKDHNHSKMIFQVMTNY